MEEKSRYKYYAETNQLYDNEKGELYAYNLNKNKIISILNRQDKQIKELKVENNFLEKRNEELIIDRRDLCLERNDIFEENQQLKQQLHDLSKKIVEEIKKELYDCGKTYLEDEPYIEICIVQGILNTILKKYGGQDG